MPALNISDSLMELIFSAVEEGMTALKSEQGLVLFAILLTKEGMVLRRFRDEDIASGIERAQKAIAEVDEDTLGYALVYDGQIEIGGQDVDALMLEAGERGKDDGWRFVQRYQAKNSSTPFYPIGDIAYLGTGENYLT